MTTRPGAALALCAAIIGLAGCTSSTAGIAAPSDVNESPVSTTTESSESDTHGAPSVDHPLDATKFLADPCSVLTSTQLATFNVSRPGQGDTDSDIAKTVGPLCIWHAEPAASSTIGVAWQSGNKNGLADLYSMRDRQEYFDETTVEGYPAVFASQLDGRDQGICDITVGVSDSLTFTASENGQLDPDAACARAKQVAAAAVVTMRGN